MSEEDLLVMIAERISLLASDEIYSSYANDADDAAKDVLAMVKSFNDGTLISTVPPPSPRPRFWHREDRT